MKMGTLEIGHKLTDEEILEKVNEFWDMDRKFPVPRKMVTCGLCGSKEVAARQYFFFKKPTLKESYRCDITARCMHCGYVWVHGLTITKEQYERGEKRRWTWQAIHKQWRTGEPATGAWDFEETFPFPAPAWTVQCPECWKRYAHTNVIIKSWAFHKVSQSPPFYFCVISFKCKACSSVFNSQVDIPRKNFVAGCHKGGSRTWTWREANELFDIVS